MEDLAPVLIGLGIPGIAVLIVIVVILNPDKAARWAELLWAAVSRFVRGADRRAVQYGLQSRINGFAREIAQQTGAEVRVEAVVQWTDAQEEPNHFFKEDRLVMRLHRHERQDRNLVTSSLLLVSQTLVRRSKRFLSKRQARSVDLLCSRSTVS